MAKRKIKRKKKKNPILSTAEQARVGMLKKLNSAEYKARLKKEIAQSDYGDNPAPSVDEVLKERISRVTTTPIQQIHEVLPYMSDEDFKKMPYLGAVQVGSVKPKIGFNIHSFTDANLNNRATKFKHQGVQQEVIDTATEELDHASLKKIFEGNIHKSNTTKGTNHSNITGYAKKVIGKNVKKKFKKGVEPYEGYLQKPVEILGKKRRVEQTLSNNTDWKYGDKFTKDQFNYLIKNPTAGSHQLLQATSGLKNPSSDFNMGKRKIKKKKSFKRTKNIMDKLAATNSQEAIMMAMFGGKLPMLANGGTVSKIGDGIGTAGDMASAIPGWGPVVGMAMNGVGELMGTFEGDGSTESAAKQQAQQNAVLSKQTALPNFNMGGFLKQYNAPTHPNGGQMIDANGNPSGGQAVANIEKDETVKDNFAFSPNLVDPVTNKTYAKATKSAQRKVKSQLNDGNDIARRTQASQERRLTKSNTKQKQMIEMAQAMSQAPAQMPTMANGGDFGDPDDPPMTALEQQAAVDDYRQALMGAQNNNTLDIKMSPAKNIRTDFGNTNKPPLDLSGIKGTGTVRPVNEVMADANTDPTIFDSSLNTDTTTAKKGGTKMSAMEGAGLALKGASVIGSAISAFRAPDQIPTNFNQNAAEAERLARNTGLSYDRARATSLASRNQRMRGNTNVMSNAVKMALDNAAQTDYVNQAGDIAFKERQGRNQQNQFTAGLLNQLGQQDVNARNLQEQLQSQTNAVSADAKKTFGQTVDNASQHLLERDVANRKSNERFKLMKNKYKNFNVSANNLSEYNNMLSNPNTDVDKIIVFAQQKGIPADKSKKDIMKYGTKAQKEALKNIEEANK